jgi:hypothetical protein
MSFHSSPPKGAVPPRINKTVKSTKNVRTPKLRVTEPINRDMDESQRRRNSIKWKDIKEERRASMIEQKPSKKRYSSTKILYQVYDMIADIFSSR